jgi:purine-binding chemotaxis protein CheW
MSILSNRFLAFSLGSEEYGIPLEFVKEVIALPTITPVPDAAPYFLGIINLRGQVISILDLRLKFGISPERRNECAIIICELGALQLGILVDSVNSVITATDGEFSEKPLIEGKDQKNMDYIINIYKKNEKLVLIFDISKVISDADNKSISEASNLASQPSTECAA